MAEANSTASRAPNRLRPQLLAAAAVLVMFAGAVGALPAWPGLIQFVALPPLDLIADVRALLVHAPNVPIFVAALIAVVAARAAVLSFLLGGLTRERYLFALRFYLLMLPFAAVAAIPVYASQAVLFYGAFWAGVFVTLLVFVVFGSVPWLASLRLRSGLRSAVGRGFRAGTLGAYLAALIVVGIVADLGGAVASVLAVPATAAVTWFAAQALYSDPGYAVARRAVALLPVAGVLALLVPLFAGPDEAPEADGSHITRDGSLMLMSGIDSRSGVGAMLELDPRFVGYTCEQTHYFSYAGPGDGQPQGEAMCEIVRGAEYSGHDTMRTRDELTAFIEAQTQEMDEPGVIFGHSQGVWLVWDAAVRDRLPNVSEIVLVGPYPANEVAFPAPDEHRAGRVGRMVLDPLETWAQNTGHTVIELDSPLGREWLGHPDAIQQTLTTPVPADVRVLSVASVFDLPLKPDGYQIDGAVNACPIPVLHPDMPYSPHFYDAVNRFLDGDEPAPCGFWRELPGPALRQFTAPRSP